MAYLHRKYFGYNKDTPIEYENFYVGYDKLTYHPLFNRLKGDIYIKSSHLSGTGAIACVTRNGDVYVNVQAKLNSDEWAYVLAHNLLHHALGHFDFNNIPSDKEFDASIWNMACDIYLARFLDDAGFGCSIFKNPASEYPIKLDNEIKIYDYLVSTSCTYADFQFGCNATNQDMIGIDHPIQYKAGETNTFMSTFVGAISNSVKSSGSEAAGTSWSEGDDTPSKQAATWFMAHYPLLGGLAASFKIIEDVDICHKYNIQIAAVDATEGEIYINPTSGLDDEELKFVLAHEYLHAGLCHHDRCQGRDHYLWNVACDYVINDWLREMNIGNMSTEGLLYDETLHGMSAESIYDLIIKEMRKYKKLKTFRGYEQGDIFNGNGPRFEGMSDHITLDDFFKNSLREGLDYHIGNNRGLLPAGLVEEIRALTMTPIPWEIELAEWFDVNFPPLEKHRTYARPSRRQASTPDIPRPNYAFYEKDLASRTFAVVIDTSGSMSTKQIGVALGAIASYSTAKEVPFVRIIYCDAEATDAGFLSPEDIAGKLEVTGRGGTVLQPGINMIEKAKNFPANGPILVITDGYIENNLKIHREHAFLIPKGNKLPFSPKGKVFYMKNYEEF